VTGEKVDVVSRTTINFKLSRFATNNIKVTSLINKHLELKPRWRFGLVIKSVFHIVDKDEIVLLYPIELA